LCPGAILAAAFAIPSIILGQSSERARKEAKGYGIDSLAEKVEGPSSTLTRFLNTHSRRPSPSDAEIYRPKEAPTFRALNHFTIPVFMYRVQAAQKAIGFSNPFNV
jgi:hypothetical protein